MKALFAFAFFVSSLGAIDLKPWYEADFQLHPRVDFLYQQYSKINSSFHSCHRSTNDLFTTLGISGTYSPWEAWLESTCAHTRSRSFGFDNIRVAGRYQWLSDTIGDPVSLVNGLIATYAPKSAVEDISSFHHSIFDLEGNISIGRETTCMQDWITRYWGVFGIGMGIQGSPWIRGDLAWEKNYCERLFFRLFLNSLWGLGNRSLFCHRFHGYGSVRHRSIDLGGRITRDSCWGVFSFEYAHRIYAYNFPAHTNLVLFRYCYPFGL